MRSFKKKYPLISAIVFLALLLFPSFGYAQETDENLGGGRYRRAGTTNLIYTAPAVVSSDVSYPNGGRVVVVRNNAGGYVQSIYTVASNGNATRTWGSLPFSNLAVGSEEYNQELREAVEATGNVFDPNAFREPNVQDNRFKDPGKPPPDCISFSVADWLKINWDICFINLTSPLFNVAELALKSVGYVFNYSLDWGLNSSKIIDSTQIVIIGWKTLRDVANLCFIFILIAIAIGTILQVDSYDVKKLLAKVIIIAILLNFSLFLSKVVVDASNILALQFYGKIAPNPGDFNTGLAGAFIDRLGLTDFRGDPGWEDSEGNIKGPGELRGIWIGLLGGAILLFVTAFVLLVGLILFVIRTIVIIFLLILSPLAFLASILPKTKTYWDSWLSMLISQSFFAPLFLLMIYIVLAAISGRFELAGGGRGNFAQFVTGNGNGVAVAYNYVVLIGLMLGALIVAKTLGAKGGDFAKDTAGKVSIGLAGMVGRRTVGFAARNLQNTAFVKRHAFLERGLNRASTASFDARNVGVFSKVTGLKDGAGKGGYAKSFEERQKRLKDQKERLEKPSIKEDIKLADAEDKRKKAQGLQSGALLRERDKAENDKTNAERTINVRKNAANAAIRLEKAEIERNESRKRILEQRLAVNPADVAAQRELASITDNIINQQNNIDGFQKNIADADEEIKGFNTQIKEADERLKKLNDDYKIGGTALDNKEVRDEITENEKKNQDYAEKNNLLDAHGNLKNSYDIQQHIVNEIQPTIKIVKEAGEERGKDFAKLDLLQRGLARMGVTTPQVGMARDIKEKARKSKQDKLLDKLIKQVSSSTPPPTSSSPTTPTPPSTP